VVLLANLFPADEGVAELDSLSFQTAGHELLPLQAAACRLPLLRRRTRGVALQTELHYGSAPVPGDEVEDLRALLAAAVLARPDAQAVCSGAIASDYQRLRVEAVCADLGLTSLAPLWRRSQAWVLSELAARSFVAVLVRVASLGLDPGQHLGKDVVTLTPLLLRLQARYGVHAAGEGGEFETIVLDCPAFTAASLQLTQTEPLAGRGGEGRLAVRASRLAPKLPCDEPLLPDVREAADAPARARAPPPEPTPVHLLPAVWLCRGSQGCSFCTEVEVSPPATAEAALARALDAVAAAMSRDGLDWRDVCTVHLQLPDMSDFAACNAAYAARVQLRAPPSRACVQHALPSALRLEVMAMCRPGSHMPAEAGRRREVLHVQSISGWAPACIGPYAQAVQTGRSLLWMAGCLGLEPASMTLPASPARQASLVVLAADAIARACGAGGLPAAALQLTLFSTGAEAEAEALAAWRELQAERLGPESSYRPDAEPETEHGCSMFDPPVLLVTLPALPRGACVELQPLAQVAPPGAPERRRSSASASAAAAWLPGVCLRALLPFPLLDAEDAPVCSQAAEEARLRLGQLLCDAGLGWEDVLALRLYRTGGSGGGGSGEALERALGRRPAEVAAAGLGLGGGAAAAGLGELGAVLELTAWREEAEDAGDDEL